VIVYAPRTGQFSLNVKGIPARVVSERTVEALVASGMLSRKQSTEPRYVVSDKGRALLLAEQQPQEEQKK
jgi:hypothetical protein